MKDKELTIDKAAEKLQKSFNELSKVDLSSLSAEERAEIRKKLEKTKKLILKLKENKS